MNEELFGLGRTWWMAILIVIAATIALVAKVDGFGAAEWQSMIQWIFTAAASAKTVEKIGTAVANKKKQEVEP